MGCNEHMYVEVKSTDGWMVVSPPLPVKDDDYDDWGWSRRYKDERDQPVPWNFGRNYACYYALTGGEVRYGDAVLLPASRGMPDDVTTEVKAVGDKTDHSHSHTHFTLAEMEAFAPDMLIGLDRIAELRDELRKVAATRGATPENVRVVVFFNN